MSDELVRLGEWSSAVVILGEDPPRIVHRAELVLETENDEPRYRLHWWHGTDDGEYSRSVHRGRSGPR